MAYQNSHFSDLCKNDISSVSTYMAELNMKENDSVPTITKSFQEVTEKLKQKEREIDILKKCKDELSNTVISLKQEIYSLKEERLKMENYNKEIKSKLLMISERNAALVQEKANLNLENQKLKMEMLSLNEARYNIRSKIGQSNIAFDTYPWLLQNEKSMVPFSSTPLKQEIPSLCKTKKTINDSKEYISESWEEVSQKLFAQMKIEMKDLEELGKKLSIESIENEICECCDIENKSLSENNFLEKMNSSQDEAEKIIIEQQQQLRNVRKHALEQNRTVRKLLQKVLNFTKSGNSFLFTNQRNIAKIYDVNDKFDSDMISNMERKFQFSRPSDESFRAYFTQQLYNGGQLLQNPQSKLSLSEKAKSTNSFTNEIEVANNNNVGIEQKTLNSSKCKEDNALTIDKTISKEAYLESDSIVENKTEVQITSTNQDKDVFRNDDRICPMCQTFFPKTVSQEDFETHVVAHFEIENNSILENFEVI